MPIFEPTQIVPSSFTTSETIAVAENVSIQWQINGNSALTAFQIDMYQNTSTSKFIYSTGKIGTGYGLPFNGIDRYGRKQYFSYAPEQNWAAWSDNAMTDGNSYKYKITQWFAAVVQVGSVATTRSFSANTTYYFRVTDQNAYVAFTPTSTLASDMANATFYYDFTTLKGWYVNADERLVPVSMNVTTSAPSGTSIGTTTSAASNEDWIQQVSESAIITRTTPTLTLAITTGGSETEQNTLISSVAVFTGTYTQAQGVAVRSTHWVLRNESGDLLEDTGVIYTSVVEYMYSGFFNGESYTLSCTVETEAGVQVTASIDFTVSYEGGTYYGDFNANCVPKEGSIYLQWEALRVISPTTSGEYTQGDGYVELPAGSSITWDKELEDTMNFQPPWFATWTGRVQTEEIKNPTSKTVTLTGTTGTDGEGETGLVTQEQVSGTANTYVDSYSPAPSYVTVSGVTSGGSSIAYMTRIVSGQTVARRYDDSEPFSFSGQAVAREYEDSEPFSFSGQAVAREYEDSEPFSFSGQATAHSATGVQPFSFSGTATPHFVGASGSQVQTTLTTSSTEIDPSTMMYRAMEIIPMSRYNVITSATVKSTTADKATAGKYDDTHIYVYAWTNEPGKTVSVTVSVSFNKYEYYATFSGEIDKNDAVVTSVNVTSYSGTSSTVSKAGNTYSITVYADGEKTVSAKGTVDYTYTSYYATFSGEIDRNDASVINVSITSSSGIALPTSKEGNTYSITVHADGEKTVSVEGTVYYTYTLYYATFSGEIDKNDAVVTSVNVTSYSGTSSTVSKAGNAYSITVYSDGEKTVSAEGTVDYTYTLYYATFSGEIDKNDASAINVSITSSSGIALPASKAGNAYSITVYSDGEKTVSAEGTVDYTYTLYYATFSGEIDKNDAVATSVNVTSYSGTSSTVSKAGNAYSITVYSDGEKTVSAEGTVDYTYTSYYSATAQGDLPYNITSYTITSQSSNVKNSMVQFEGTRYGWEATADSAGQTVSLTIRFSVSVNSTPYYSTTRYFPNITSASIASVTSGTNATVTVNTSADTYTVTIYGSSNGQAVSARVQLNATYQIYKYETTEEFKGGTITAARLIGYSGTDGSVSFTPDSYTVSLKRYGTGSVNGTVELTYDGLTYEVTLNNPFTDGFITNATIISTTGSGANIEFTDTDYSLTLYSHQPNDEVTAEVKFDYYYLTYNNIPQGKFWEIQSNNITFTRTGNIIYVGIGDTAQAVSFTPPTDCVLATFAVSPTTIYAYFFNAKGVLTQKSAAVTYTQGAVTSVAIYGGTNGSTVYNVAVYEGDGSNVLPRLEDDGYEPTWGSPYYDLSLNANFNGNIEGGTGSALNNGFRIYREEVGTNVLVPIYTAGATETQLKDYGVVSGKAYTYYLYVYDNTNAFMQQKPLGYDVPFNLNKYTLIVADYDSSSDTYHAIKEYIFRENASVGSISNNNTPTLSENFTGFPTRTKSVQNYKSGTLSSLIGTIYKRTDSDEESGANSGTLAYHDSVELEQELYDLSVSDYTLFLRDPKGHLFMVRTQSPITQGVDYARVPMPITISLPWVETGDASDVSIIQAPTDIGWNYDNDVLKTRLHVNLDTGRLIAEYPPNYNGSTFFITGDRDNKLAAETPQTVTPAEFTYSEEALDPHDGELTATVTRLVDDGTQTAEADEGSGEGISDNGEKE